MDINLVAAFDKDCGIGKKNKLPWNMPTDMKRFKDLTLNKTVIMGRKTFASMGKPLPKRKNIVLTRNLNFAIQGAIVLQNIEQAFKYCTSEKEVWIIGGEQIFKEALPLANRMYLTRIEHSFDCDTFFAKFDETEWVLDKEEVFAPDEQNPYPFVFLDYQRLSK